MRYLRCLTRSVEAWEVARTVSDLIVVPKRNPQDRNKANSKVLGHHCIDLGCKFEVLLVVHNCPQLDSRLMHTDFASCRNPDGI